MKSQYEVLAARVEGRTIKRLEKRAKKLKISLSALVREILNEAINADS